MLIDSYYFTYGARRINSLTLGERPLDPRQREIREFVDGCIDSYVPVYLSDTFGIENGMVLLRHIKNPDLHTDTSELDELCEKLKEPCADYVYCRILSDAQCEATIDGVIRHKLTDYHVSPLLKQVNVWNGMIEKHMAVKEWLEKNSGLKGLKIDSLMLKPINRFNL